MFAFQKKLNKNNLKLNLIVFKTPCGVFLSAKFD